jgi:hypothetical protein
MLLTSDEFERERSNYAPTTFLPRQYGHRSEEKNKVLKFFDKGVRRIGDGDGEDWDGKQCPKNKE